MPPGFEATAEAESIGVLSTTSQSQKATISNFTVSNAFPEQLYAADFTSDNLYTLDEATGAETLIGSTAPGATEVGGMTWDGNALWLINSSPSGGLYTLDIETGQATLQGQTNIPSFQGLAADPTDNGQLYGASSFGIFRIEPDGQIENLGFPNGTFTGLAFDAAGSLWGIEASSGDVGIVDKTTGDFDIYASTLSGFEALTFTSEGTLLGHRSLDDALYIIDTDTGDTTLVGANGTSFIRGLAFGAPAQADAEIHGQKWNDLDADGIRDANEPGLNGWEIQLYDSEGTLIATQITADVDLNDDQSIDPMTERGLYSFTELVAGTYTVAEVQQDGWEQTSPGGNGAFRFLSSSAGANQLLELQTDPSAETLIGTPGFSPGLDFDPTSGLLYGASDTLRIIDPSDGSAVSIGSIDSQSTSGIAMDSIAFDPNGNLFGVSAAGDVLFSIDKTNGFATLVGTIPGNAGGIDFAPDGTLYEGSDDLNIIDPLTGQVLATLGPLTTPVLDLDFAIDGSIYAIGTNRELFAVNPGTAVQTLVGSYASDIRGLATEPITSIQSITDAQNDFVRGPSNVPLPSTKSYDGGAGVLNNGHHTHDQHFVNYVPPKASLGRPGELLSQPADGKPLEIAIDFLRQNASELGLTVSDLDHFRVTDHYRSEHIGVTHIYLRQVYQGLDVTGADININVTDDGQVINVGSSFLSSLPDRFVSATAKLTAQDALQSLSDHFGWTMDATPQVLHSANRPGWSTLLTDSGVSRENIPATLHYIPSPKGGVELSWKLNVQTTDGDHWYEASVDAISGNVSMIDDWVSHATYNVFAQPLESPTDGNRTLEVDPASTAASPFGWHDTNGVAGPESTLTIGNNVEAYTDRNDDDVPDLNSSPDGGAGLVFDNPLDLALAPDTYQDAAVTNLFYWNNLIHDVHYAYGFDEASGNFQTNNYGKGGAGNDAVQAQAQDGADVGNANNANMATPPDGIAPRMQMYLWNLTTPNRDGDFDNGIIIHEYGHGVSNRLTGGPGNSGALGANQSRGMGEGWSDWHGLMLTQIPADVANDARGIGTYALGQPSDGAGIRTQRYSYDMSVNTLTYADVRTQAIPHGVGEVWASALWDLNWALIGGSSLDPSLPTAGLGFDADLINGTGGNNLAMQLVMDGMKLQPALPTFLDARDAILQADQLLTGGTYYETIWQVFARRGMGYSADDGGSANSVSVTAAFDLPATEFGIIDFDAATYEIGDSVTIRIRDLDLQGLGTYTTDIVSDSGDSEFVLLTETDPGVFVGSIVTNAATGGTNNGILNVTLNDEISSSYLDADDGTGQSQTSTATADIIAYIDIFNQDFESGLSPAESLSGLFTVNSSNGQLTNGTLMVGHPNASTNNEYSYYQVQLDLTGYAGAQLAFEYAAEIESFWDGVNVQASTSAISPPNDLIEPLEGLTYSSALGLPEIGTLAYSNGGGSVERGVALFDLSPFDDQVVNIRIQFGSDGSVTYAGFNLDNLRVRVPDDGSGSGPNRTHTVVLGPGEIVMGVDFGNHEIVIDYAEIHGQKWHDLNGDGIHDANEPGLNGWEIQLKDRDGNILATQFTADVDLNGDETIDPLTESGLYSFLGLEGGEYLVGEVQQAGWEQTSPNPGAGSTFTALVDNDALTESSQTEPAASNHHHHEPNYLDQFVNYQPPLTHLVTPGTFLATSSDTDSAGDQTAFEIATDYLVEIADSLGLNESDLQDFVVTDQYVSEHNGVTHLYLRQLYNGLPIVGADINVNVTAGGDILNVGSSFLSGLDASELVATQPKLSATEALVSLATQYGWDLSGQPVALESAVGAEQKTLLSASGVSTDDIPAELHYVPTADGNIALAWKLNVQTVDGDHWLDASVSADSGGLMHVDDWVSHATYNVFAAPLESPNDGARSLEVDPEDPAASPFGWHDTNGVAGAESTLTIGNNVTAYADRNDDNSPDVGSSPDGGAGLVFDFPLDLAQEPLVYRDAAVTNLFYWNNVIHDVHYAYGFNEASGNFQTNNYGNGGLGGDAVQAEAQDGADVGNANNANMATPPDGVPPRMQMFVWSSPTPDRDGDLDNGIIVHEYGHGVSNRLTGGPSNSGALGSTQSRGMGEGWSDWHALMLTQVPSDQATDAVGIGTYALNQSSNGPGIRSQRYSYDMSVNTLTYANIATQAIPHGIGEVWASTLWDLNWALIEGTTLDANLPNAGLGFDADLIAGTGGNNLAMQLVMDGMKLQPAQPTFLDARDGILAADLALTGGVNQDTIWTVFARRGMGFSADDGGSANNTAVTEAFDLPSTPLGIVQLDRGEYETGDLVTVTLRDRDLTGTGPLSIDIHSSGGDTETVSLTELGSGAFRGTIATAGPGSVGDSLLNVSIGDTISVQYNDADDGTGNPAVVSDNAVIVFNPLDNGSFEEGDFYKWDTGIIGNPFVGWSVSPAGGGTGFGMVPTQPQDGQFSAVHGFDGSAGTEFTLSQQIEIPGDALSTLHWQDRIQWNFDLGAEVTIPRTHEVSLVNPNTGATLETLYSYQTPVQAEQSTGDTGWLMHSADLSAYMGMTVELLFEQVIPEGFAGPGQFELDDVRLEVQSFAGQHYFDLELGEIVTDADFGNREIDSRTDVVVDLPEDASNDVVIWKDGNDLLVQQAVGGNVLFTSPIADVKSLTVNGGALVDSIDIDHSRGGAFSLPDGITVDGAGGFDTVTVIGVADSDVSYHANGTLSAGATVTLQAGTVVNENSLLNVDWLEVWSVKTFTPTSDLDIGINTFFIDALDSFDLPSQTMSAGGNFFTTNGFHLPIGSSVSGHGSLNASSDPARGIVLSGSTNGQSATQMMLLDGHVSGTGSLDHVHVLDAYSPGNSASVVNHGSVVYGGSSEIILEIGGTAPGTGGHDQVNHSGMATLNGDLTVELIDGFTPAEGDSFVLMTATGGFVGSPANVTLPPAPAGTGWDLDLDANEMRLTLKGPAHVNEVRMSDGEDSTQRSIITQIDVEFNDEVEVDADAFTLTRLGGGAVDHTFILSLNPAGNTVATLTFSGVETRAANSSLVDGNYQLEINASKVRLVGTTLTLDGNLNGEPGGNFMIGDDSADNFFALYGDGDGDRDVDGLDLGAFGQAFLKQSGHADYRAALDHDSDGDIDGLDLGAFGQNFLRTI